MPPKPKETTVQGFCAKMQAPPKGVGGAVIQSIELKRNVSQSRRGNKVFERAIEERQTAPGLTTTRVGTKVYYFDNADSAFNAKMERINKELSAKCDEMDKLDASLAENELRMAKLDAELEKLDIIGDDAIEDAMITESEDLDLLLVPSIQNLIFKIYSESGITIPSDSDTCAKKGPSKDELKDICKKFCKDEFEKLEREKNNKNLQSRPCDQQPARVDSPCVELSTASEISDPENQGNRQHLPAAQRQPRVATPLEQCKEDCERNFGGAPQRRPQQQPFVAVSSSETDSGQNSGIPPCLEEPIRPFGNPAGQRPQNRPPSPAPPARRQPPQNCQRPPQQQQRPRAPATLEQCIEDCDRNFGGPNRSDSGIPPCLEEPIRPFGNPAGQRPQNRPPSPAPPARRQPPQNCQRPPQQQQRPRGPATLEQCIEDCDRNFGGQNRAPRERSPCQAAPQHRQQPPQPACRLQPRAQPPVARPQPQNRPPPAGPPCRPQPVPRQQPPPAEVCGNDNHIAQDRALASCIDDCERKFGNRPPSPPPPVRRPPPQNRPPQPAPVCRPQPAPCGKDGGEDAALAACLAECDRKFGNEQQPHVNAPQPQPPAPPPPSAPPPQDRPCRPPPAPAPLDKCIKDCENKFGKAPKRISPRPPLFSRILNGKRCFPDISEIPQKDQTLYMAERDAYVLFRRQFADRGNECTFFELPDEFEEFFYNYINGTSKINVPMCPPKPTAPPKSPQKKSSEEIIQSFVDLQKIELDTALQRNVVDLALDRPDRDPEVIALLMNERLPLWIDPLVMSELAIPYPLHKRLFATDVRHTAPGSMVPRTIPVQALNLMNTHVMEGVEAIIKSNEYVYPIDNIATKEIEAVAVVKPEKEENAEEHPPENYRCVIELHPFRVETFFQLRGANVPLWYPGMFTAFPDGRSSIKLVSTPSALINTAWRMCAP